MCLSFIYSSNWHMLYIEVSLSHLTWDGTYRFARIIYNIDDICTPLFKASCFLKSSVGWLLQVWKYTSSQKQEARSRVGSIFPGCDVQGLSSEEWGLLVAGRGHCPVQGAAISPGPASSGKGSNHDDQDSFFKSPEFFQLSSLYLTSLEILCFIIEF